MVTVRRDPTSRLTLEQVLAEPLAFQAKAGVVGNFGKTGDAVWLRLPVRVPEGPMQERVLLVDYPALNSVELWHFRPGQRDGLRMVGGNQHRVSERAMGSRSPAFHLRLAPGDHTLVLRVASTSSMVIPLALIEPDAFTAEEATNHLLLGGIGGVAICMLIYSLAHFVSLRNPVFLDYAMLLLGNLIFIMTNFGVSGLYLWPDHPSLSMRISPLGVMVAICFGGRFMRQVLNTAEVNRTCDFILKYSGWVGAVTLVLGTLGFIPYPLLQTLAVVIGLTMMMSVLPVAFIRARRGERVAAYLLCGWMFYFVGALSQAALLRGHLVPSFWTQYLYPVSNLLEMMAWMGVLGLAVKSIQREADLVKLEREAMRTMANTDPLTGLPNRRGLQDRLTSALQQGDGPRLALLMVDLDGFKPVNDRHGHDVGDALLIGVGRRLQEQLRSSDTVARLGGDEFVVLAQGVDNEADALQLGEKLLTAFSQPFEALGYRVSVGLTIGFALAPGDGLTSDVLLKRADEALYRGKAAGRGRVLRADATPLPTRSTRRGPADPGAPPTSPPPGATGDTAPGSLAA